MDYKIIDIEGVGDVYAPKLIAAGIKKVSELLEKCATPKGRDLPRAELELRAARNWLRKLASARN